VPRGDDYFDQKDMIRDLRAMLERNNVLLIAPRRFGKTAAMYRILDDPTPGFYPLYMDVEAISSPSEFMVEIIAVLLRDRHFSRAVVTLFKGVKDFGKDIVNLPESLEVGEIKIKLREKTDVQNRWLDYGERVMSMLAREDPRMILLIDEFPIMINAMLTSDMGVAEQFLRWFRAVRIAPDTKVRFVIGGSTNIVAMLDEHAFVDTINDLYLFRLKPFDRDTASQYVRVILISRNVEFTDKVVDGILDLLGASIPYLLAVFLQAIIERSRAKDGPVDLDLVRATFDEDLLGGATSMVFQHYRSRLLQYYPGKEREAAEKLIGFLSRTDRPLKRESLYDIYLKAMGTQDDRSTKDAFTRLIWKLDNDFYIFSVNDRYEFYSRVLKLWWRRNYG
jgi:hypothetical protein